MLRFIRLASTSTTKTRPELSSILPSKRTINRILFDNDSPITYSRMMPILTNIYNNLSQPSKITIPNTVKPSDLMVFRKLLTSIRSVTQSVNKNLLDLENELVEQAAERGDLDAITMLAFEKVRENVRGELVVDKAAKEDLAHANKLITELTQLKHPLVFKMAGDLAFEKKVFATAVDYWQQFLALEDDTIEAGHVYYNLGYYYFSQPPPVQDLPLAKKFFQNCIALTDLDLYSTKAHYYLGQLYLDTNPRVAKYFMEISASKSLLESFASLGFLEMNKFNNYEIAIEWFKLGVEANRDLLCLIGQFDCYIKMKQWAAADKVLRNLNELRRKISDVKKGASKKVPDSMKESFQVNDSLLASFFQGRKQEFELLQQNI
ncbi:hypothetical protein FOB58_004937 [Candida parapsilosis]|uniref:Protein MSS2, mitochondrial n=2 Tax=Candida parapsilosis TaxID=5480 RepID=G8BGP9_CANPC|nr:uncharacterized protein CPAR2_502710 [Candida parapsilosis]KAF6044653.1 hypothetical protein FOB58_004937 [Candida parapsilosis]KAF6044960.1 hypothetical protein FOB59_004437 [Candida parapsilosis]KAF6048894.1 hypothetical protein FOB60_004277 [Candida parapsilosis]KAF6060894.1 hypothetical protein FOB61_004902 [Candida parapsilosis]KAI5904734.1 Protein MSS2 [Candida parapsilosis]